MSLELAQVAVGEFHRDVVRLDRQSLSEADWPSDMMEAWAAQLSAMAEEALRLCVNDKRLLRAHLLMEELGELLLAMNRRDEVETLDGLADLLYVTLGTAEMLDLPLGEAFWEVHRSNMTKERQPDDPHANRVRSKGPGYVPPDVRGILERYRGVTTT